MHMELRLTQDQVQVTLVVLLKFRTFYTEDVVTEVKT